MVALIDRGRLDIKLNGYGTAPAAALADPGIHPRVQDYRRQAARRMVALEPRDIRTRVPAASYHVSRKVDGEFTVLVYRDGQALSVWRERDGCDRVFVASLWKEPTPTGV